MVDVRDAYPRFQQAGGEVVMVGMGTPQETAAFRDQLRLPFPCLADADQTAYQAYGLERGRVSQIAGPAVWLSGLKALVRGGAGKPKGDVRQMPGSFVIDRDGRIQYVHRPRNSADHPPNDKLIAALGVGSRQ
jgi:peroxiredoxin